MDREKKFELCNHRKKSKPKRKDNVLIKEYNFEMPTYEIYLNPFRSDITIPWYLNDVLVEELCHTESSNKKSMNDIRAISGNRDKSKNLLANQIIRDDGQETDISDGLDERTFAKDSLEIYSSKETHIDSFSLEDSLEISSVKEDKSSKNLKNVAKEKMASYLYGVHIPKHFVQTQTLYKKSTAFIIPFESDELIKNYGKHSTYLTEKTEAEDLHSFHKPMSTPRDIVRLYLSNTNKPIIPNKSNSAEKIQTDLLTSEIRLQDQESHIQDDLYEKFTFGKYIGNKLHTIVEVNEGDINEHKKNNHSYENEGELSSSWAKSKESEEFIPPEKFEDIFETSTTNCLNLSAAQRQNFKVEYMRFKQPKLSKI